jgi:hypothetical protein
MSLYLTIFDGADEINGWVFGHYSDFGYFRDTIRDALQVQNYPILLQHSDCDGEWLPHELGALRQELLTIGERFKALPAKRIENAFEHSAEIHKKATNLYDCFHNADGENVFEALVALCDLGISRQRAILFQ